MSFRTHLEFYHAYQSWKIWKVVEFNFSFPGLVSHGISFQVMESPGICK
jgi:hypothetical protein